MTENDRRTSVEPALHSVTVLVAAVIVHDRAADRIALLQRAAGAKFGQGLWDLPTGKREPGEPITDTAVRELHEETGLVVKPESLRLAHLTHGAWGVGCPDGFLVVVFAAHEWGGALENPEPEKHAQVRWADLSDLPTEFVPSTDKALHAYRTAEIGVSLRGWD